MILPCSRFYFCLLLQLFTKVSPAGKRSGEKHHYRRGRSRVPGPVKSDAVSPTSHNRCDVSSEPCWPSARPQR